jgi:hypothetical protein
MPSLGVMRVMELAILNTIVIHAMNINRKRSGLSTLRKGFLVRSSLNVQNAILMGKKRKVEMING